MCNTYNVLKIEIHYLGLTQDLLKLPGEKLELPSAVTICELFSILDRRHNNLVIESVIAANGDPLPNALILLNGSNILHQQGMETQIIENCKVQILLLPGFIGGG